MRRIALLFALIIVISGLNFSTSAIEADGDIQFFEWEGSVTTVLFDEFENSGCNIQQAIVRYNYNSELRELSLAFICIEKPEMNEERNTGVSFSLNCEERIVITDEADFDSELYDIVFGRNITAKNGFTYEMKIILKKLGYEEIDLEVFFTDTYGIPSKEYKMKIYDRTEEELTTSLPQSASYSEEKKNKTTAVKTTKPKTTKQKTTKRTTEKTTKTTTLSVVTVTTEPEISTDPDEKVAPKKQKILKYISVGGIVMALTVIVISSARGDD